MSGAPSMAMTAARLHARAHAAALRLQHVSQESAGSTSVEPYLSIYDAPMHESCEPIAFGIGFLSCCVGIYISPECGRENKEQGRRDIEF